MESYRTLFTSLWAASDARLLTSMNMNGPSSMYQFLSAVIDCIVLASIRLNRKYASDETGNPGQVLAAEELSRVWADGILPEGSRLVRMDRSMMGEMRIESTKEVGMVAKALSRLAQEADGTLSSPLRISVLFTEYAFEHRSPRFSD